MTDIKTNNRLTLIILTGAPGCGKSTLAEKINSDDKYIILSSDELRGILGKSEEDQSVSGKVFAYIREHTKNNLKNNKNVIIDATSMTIKSRKDFIKIGKEQNAFIQSIAIESTLNILVERNKQRKLNNGRLVPTEIIERMLNSYQSPSKDEGFNEITIIINDNE